MTHTTLDKTRRNRERERESQPVCQQRARSVPGLYAAHCPRPRTSKTQSLHDAEVRKKQQRTTRLVQVTDSVSRHSHTENLDMQNLYGRRQMKSLVDKMPVSC